MCLEHKPNIIIDAGGDLVGMGHGPRPDLAAECWGGCEETTTGIIRLKAMAREGILKFPMVAVNDADCKHLFDNRYGTGQSVWDSIMHNTNLIVASKTVVVVGYGWCSRGIAMRAAALGAHVIVTEINPVKAMEAKMDGYDVMTMAKAAPLGDIFISATGCRHTITVEHMLQMKNRAILANAGHFNVEIDMAGLEKAAVDKKETRKNITGYTLPNGRMVNIIGEGKLANIAAGDGHPAEIMDLSFAVQILGAQYIMDAHREAAGTATSEICGENAAGTGTAPACAYGAGGMSVLPDDVIDVSAEIDDIIARRRLEAWGIEIDKLTAEQEAYLNSWEL